MSGGGGDGGSGGIPINNIRVLGIGGSVGQYVDSLQIMYITNYEPSTLIAQNASFIISFSAPNEVFTTYQDTSYRSLDSYTIVTEHTQAQQYSASVEAEYYAKVAASAQLSITDLTSKTILQELETKIATGLTSTQTIAAESVGVKMVTGNLMQEPNSDKYWMIPTSEQSNLVLSIDDFSPLLGSYDLTGLLYRQVPGLEDNLVPDQNGYVYYKVNSSS